MQVKDSLAGDKTRTNLRYTGSLTRYSVCYIRYFTHVRKNPVPPLKALQFRHKNSLDTRTAETRVAAIGKSKQEDYFSAQLALPLIPMYNYSKEWLVC